MTPTPDVNSRDVRARARHTDALAR